MSNNFVPDATDLLAGELARASDINLRYGYVVSGFDKLPAPLSSGQGFSAAVPVGAPTADSHAVTKLYTDTTVITAANAAALAHIQPSVTAAANSATAASNSETNSGTSETNAGTSATNAATSQSAAATSATQSATSATSSAASATSAGTSESNAASSATAAASSATNAASSATTAGSSETAAGNSATAASSSATGASNSASAASTSESNAATSATASANSATAAAASYDSFDDRYLGTKSSAPAANNDGDALVVGSLYFDTTSDEMKVYGNSAWQQVATTTTVNFNAADGGFASSVYTAAQSINGGTASG